MRVFEKDPSALLDYHWDFSDWLGNDVISSFEFTTPVDLVLEDSSEAGGKVTGWFSGGTLNKSHVVVCQILTAGGRREQRSARFDMIDK